MLLPVQGVVEDLNRLTTQSVTVSVIAGWPMPNTKAEFGYRYNHEAATSTPEVIPVCETRNGTAAPALRLKQFVDAFGAKGKMVSICQDDFSSAMGQIGELITTSVACR